MSTKKRDKKRKKRVEYKGGKRPVATRENTFSHEKEPGRRFGRKRPKTPPIRFYNAKKNRQPPGNCKKMLEKPSVADDPGVLGTSEGGLHKNWTREKRMSMKNSVSGHQLKKGAGTRMQGQLPGVPMFTT